MFDGKQETDESLMERIQHGDHQAFTVLVRRHSSRFYAAAYRMCAHVEEAEDIVQEAFVKLWNRPERWEASKGVKFTTWFYKVVMNTALDILRKRKDQVGSNALDFLPDPAEGADERLESMEQEDLIEAAIQSLPERQRTALNLCFYEGLSNAEAAEIMDVGVKALESLLSRAKAGLRDQLSRQGVLKDEKDKQHG